jgi:hypothetical protein
MRKYQNFTHDKNMANVASNEVYTVQVLPSLTDVFQSIWVETLIAPTLILKYTCFINARILHGSTTLE